MLAHNSMVDSGRIIPFAFGLLALSSLSFSWSMSAALSSARYLQLSNGDSIAHYVTEGSVSPGIICLTGFRSNMNGIKAMALEQYCQETNRSFVRFDYRGHGESSGDFEDLTLTDWIQDSLQVLDKLTTGPQILVGSSMGAWIAVHVALQRPERVAGFVGLAAAPDFTHDIYNSLTVKERQILHNSGILYQPSLYSDEPYPITRKLLEDAQQYLLLNKSSLPITCPVSLLHGQLDKDISWTKSMKLANLLESPNVAVTLVKNGNHRLSEPDDLARMISAIELICKQCDNNKQYS